jgi:small redox-active disulfide protein 2
MKIEILGSGCQKCNDLTDNVKKALTTLGIEAEIVKVTDFKDIMNYGVMTTPALVVDGVVKSTGKLLTPQEIANYLK